MEIAVGFEAKILPRRGLAIKNGITVLNSSEAIDADYNGEVKVIMINLSEVDFVVKDGERICQMVICRHGKAERCKVDRLIETERG